MLCLFQAQVVQSASELGEVVGSHALGGSNPSKVVDVVEYVDGLIAEMPGH